MFGDIIEIIKIANVFIGVDLWVFSAIEKRLVFYDQWADE